MRRRKEASGPLESVADSFARLAQQAAEDRKRARRGSWDDAEALGRFNAYRNASARIAALCGGGE